MGKKNTEEALADETDKLVAAILERGVDGIIAGFPCQDISTAGYAHTDSPGLAGKRSGLFWLVLDTFRLVGCRYLLLENVAALFQRNRSKDMGAILGGMASIGCDSEWDCVCASTAGAPHHRARAFILAHARGLGWRRFFPRTVSRQPEYDHWKDVRRVEDIPARSSAYESILCRGGHGAAKRLHGIGNGNPPCIIRELTRELR